MEKNKDIIFFLFLLYVVGAIIYAFVLPFFIERVLDDDSDMPAYGDTLDEYSNIPFHVGSFGD